MTTNAALTTGKILLKARNREAFNVNQFSYWNESNNKQYWSKAEIRRYSFLFQADWDLIKICLLNFDKHNSEYLKENQ